MLLTTELLFHYQRCHRRAFLDVCTDPLQRDRPSEFLQKLQHDASAYRQSIISQQTYSQPRYYWKDKAAGAMATLELMRQGVERIYQGMLLKEGPDGVTLATSPDLLLKQPGESCFGDWFYLPADIKMGRRPKLDYQLVATFHALVLSSVQGVWPDTSLLLLREKGEYSVNLELRVPQVQELISNCIEMLRSHQEPEVFISRHPCSFCHWYSSCYAIAKAEQHLSLLPGVTSNRYALLQALSVTTVEALAATDPAQLEVFPEFADNKIAPQLVLQAQAVLENRAIATDAAAYIHPGDLPVSPVELYFDLEAEPELNLDYLHGVLVVDRRTNTQKFYSFLAERAEDEELVWKQFLDLVWSYPIAPIFHFCNYEAQTVKRLAKRYNTPAHQWRPVLKRLVDIHERVTRTVVLPVESYGLKHLARWLGFEWRDASANGGQSVYWYDEWLATGDRTFLEAIVRYNEDDCRATYLLKDWLANFLW